MPKCDKCNADFDSEFLQDDLCSFCFVANAQYKEKEKSDELGLVQMKVWIYPELISSVNQYVENINKQHDKMTNPTPGTTRHDRISSEGLKRLEAQLKNGSGISQQVLNQWIKRYGDKAVYLIAKYQN